MPTKKARNKRKSLSDSTSRPRAKRAHTAQPRDARAQLLHLRAAIDSSPDMIYLVDPQTLQFIYVNQTAVRLSGYSLADHRRLGPAPLTRQTPEQLRRTYQETIARGDEGMTVEYRTLMSDGRPSVVEIHRRAIKMGRKWIIVSVSRDIGVRKRAELAALRLRRIYAALGATNEAIIRTRSPEELYQRVCEAAVDGGEFLSAAVLLPHADGRQMRIAAVAGSAEPQLRQMHMSLDANVAEGRGLVGTAYRTLAPAVSDVFLKDERTRPWHTLAEQAGIRSGAAAPIVRGGRAVGVLLLYSGEKRAFHDEAATLLKSMADNIAFALENFEREIVRKRSEEQLRQSEARFRALTQLSSDWYWEHDTEFRFLRFEGHNRESLQHFIGKTAKELGFEPETGWDDYHARLSKREVFRDLIVSYSYEGATRYVSISGEPMFDDAGNFIGHRGVSRDITGRKRAEARIEYLATHDGLTGLPNRSMFGQLLELAIQSAKRYERRFAVLFIDLDRFKIVNDTLGHEAGDALLKEMAARFRECLRASDVVARLGGDEFVVLVQEVSEASQVEAVARKLISAALKPVSIVGQECRVTASVGISMYPNDAPDGATLMKHADIAMYLAKEQGKNNFQFYSPDIKTRSLERMTIESNLRRALELNELFLHYQAKVDLKHSRITGVEALLRWHNPDLGDVSPMQFIPVAEESGLIVPIGRWVLRTACAQNVAWQREGLPPVCIAVNLSPRQFADPELVDDVAAALRETGMAPEQLELEITEGMVMHNTERAIKVLTAIKRMGVRVAIDDFGTGYSSLAQLKRFPIDTLKVDRSFIRELARDSEDRAITQAIIAMGKSLSLNIVAEGVETEQQQSFLREHACDEMQGYYFSKPVAPEDFAELLRRDQSTRR